MKIWPLSLCFIAGGMAVWGYLTATQPEPGPWLEHQGFEACKFDATKRPTDTGVRLAYALCEEKFPQQKAP